MRRQSFSRKVFNVFNIVFMCLMLITMLFPYSNILAKAFNDGKDTAKGGITIFPRVFTLENFQTIILDEAFPRAFILSVGIVIGATVLTLVVQFMAAYALTRKDLIGRSALLVFFMIPMYFGGGLIPTYIMYSKIGLLNNVLVYLLPTCFGLYTTVIIRSYINGLPGGLTEAARIDGASELTILWKIIVPLSKPIMATIALWTAVGKWNDWTTTMYFVTKRRLFTLQYMLVQVLKETQMIQNMIDEALKRGEQYIASVNVTTEAVKCAQIIVTTIPIVLVYPFLQKYFIKGVMVGAIKD